MRMSQDKQLLPCASSPPPHVSITFGPESWWMSLDVVHFLPYTINLSESDRSAACMKGVHLQGHLASWLSYPAPISLCLMSQDLVPVEWCWAPGSCSTCMQWWFSPSSGVPLSHLEVPGALMPRDLSFYAPASSYPAEKEGAQPSLFCPAAASGLLPRLWAGQACLGLPRELQPAYSTLPLGLFHRQIPSLGSQSSLRHRPMCRALGLPVVPRPRPSPSG